VCDATRCGWDWGWGLEVENGRVYAVQVSEQATLIRRLQEQLMVARELLAEADTKAEAEAEAAAYAEVQVGEQGGRGGQGGGDEQNRQHNEQADQERELPVRAVRKKTKAEAEAEAEAARAAATLKAVKAQRDDARQRERGLLVQVAMQKQELDALLRGQGQEAQSRQW
jgi:hypothetical protein